MGLTLICILLLPSCATNRLWENTNPNEKLWVDTRDIADVELRNGERDYEYLSCGAVRGYMVEKSDARKVSDFMLRALGTPVTLTLDSAVMLAYVLGNSGLSAAHPH